jgi:hypothetical protein
MLIPKPLIEPLRAALASQGFDPRTVGSDGSINPAGFLAGAYEEIQIRTRATPTITMRTRELLDEGPPSPVLKWLQPTIILKGRSGETVIAPFGVSPGGSLVPGLLVVGGLIGFGFLLGRASV